MDAEGYLYLVDGKAVVQPVDVRDIGPEFAAELADP